MHIFNRMKIIAKIYPGVSKVSISSCYTFLNKDFGSVYNVFTRSEHRQSHVSFVICLNSSTTSKMYSDNYCGLEEQGMTRNFARRWLRGMQNFFSIVFFSVSQVFSPEQMLGEIILLNISVRSLTQGPESHLNSFLSITMSVTIM